MDNTGYSFQYTDNTSGRGWSTISSDQYTEAFEQYQFKPYFYTWIQDMKPEKEDKMEVWEYVIVLLDEDDEKAEVKESGFVVAKDRDRAIAKAASEYAIADNEMVLVRKFCA